MAAPARTAKRVIGFCKKIAEGIGDNRTKFKIVITFYQIVTHIEHTYPVTYPTSCQQMLNFFTFLNPGRLVSFLPSIRAQCLGLTTLLSQLTFAIIAPLRSPSRSCWPSAPWPVLSTRYI